MSEKKNLASSYDSWNKMKKSHDKHKHIAANISKMSMTGSINLIFEDEKAMLVKVDKRSNIRDDNIT
jgi:hypothetical protein